MSDNQTGLRRTHGLPVRRSLAGRSNGHRPVGRSRSLRMESLEQRSLLSAVAMTEAMTFKSLDFTASGTVSAPDFESGDYTIHLSSGNATLSKGTLAYSSVDQGELTNTAVLSGGGSYTATGPQKFGGKWTVGGYSNDLADNSETLSGTVVVDSSTLKFPAGYGQADDIFNGTYTVSSATFDTSDFSIAMDLVSEDSVTTLTFTGKAAFSGSAFAIDATPSWNVDGSVDVDVAVTGKPHTTDDRDAAVGNVALYWSNGNKYSATKSTLATDATDTIPVYWNEAGASYTVSDLNDAPAGTTYLLVVSTDAGTGKKTVEAALPYTASIATDASLVQERDGEATFTVTLPHASAAGVTVTYTTVKGKTDKVAGTLGATPGVDYGDLAGKNKEVTGSIVIGPGETEGTIRIPILDDTTYETGETFSVKITKVVNAGLGKVNNQAGVTIASDDAQPTVNIDNVTKAEGNSGTTKFTFTVSLSNPSYQPISVYYATADGTATAAGKDYTAVTKAKLLSFSAGQTTPKTVTISVKGDKIGENDEWFLVNLSSPTNATIGKGQGTGTITDDDGGVAASRDAALGQLAAYFGEYRQGKSDKDAAATDSALAVL